MRLPIPGLASLAGLAGLVRLLPQGYVEPKVVVVTGASSGIGKATARRMAGNGHYLVLVARREEVLDEVADDCRAEGASSVSVVPTDVGEDDAVARLVDRVLDEHGRIDAVLHCAGVVAYGRTEDVSAKDFDDVVRINLLGTANLARHVIPVLRRQERGDLILVGSLLGHIAVPTMTPYVVSKWGVRALARQLSIENGDLPDVHISHLAPGSVDTPIYDKGIDDDGLVNTPPPPVVSPERVARAVESRLAHPRTSSQTAYANYALLLAFNAAPRAYDRLIGPAFQLVSKRKATELELAEA